MNNEVDRVDVPAKSVVRVVLQYLKENHFDEAFSALQKETNVTLSAVEDRERFVSDVNEGKLCRLLDVCESASLPSHVLFNIFEHICLELLDSRDLDAFDTFLNDSNFLDRYLSGSGGGHQTLAAHERDGSARTALASTNTTTITASVELTGEESNRFAKIKALRAKKLINDVEVWESVTAKSRRRRALARQVVEQLDAIPRGQLLRMLGDAIRWRTSLGTLSSKDTVYDILSNKSSSIATENSDELDPPLNEYSRILFDRGDDRCTTLAFAADSCTLAAGFTSGVIKLYDWTSGSPLKLSWSEGTTLQHLDEAKAAKAAQRLGAAGGGGGAVENCGLKITCLRFSDDCQVLASADERGSVKLWILRDGRLGQKIPNLHTRSINTIRFHPTAPVLLTSSVDGTAKLCAIQSATVTGIMTGHEGHVTSAIFDGVKAKHVLTTCTDGFVRLYSTKNSCLVRQFAIRVSSEGGGGAAGPLGAGSFDLTNVCALCIQADPTTSGSFYVTTASSTLSLVTSKGDVLKTIVNEESNFKFIGNAAVTPKGKWIVAPGSNGEIGAYSSEERGGTPTHKIPMHGPNASVEGHKLWNLIAAYTPTEARIYN